MIHELIELLGPAPAALETARLASTLALPRHELALLVQQHMSGSKRRRAAASCGTDPEVEAIVKALAAAPRAELIAALESERQMLQSARHPAPIDLWMVR